MNNEDMNAESKLAVNEVATCGELFADGSTLELLAGNRLALVRDHEVVTGESLDCNDRRYRPCPLDAGLQSTLHLPAQWASSLSTPKLVENLSALAQTRAGMEEIPAQLWATAILNTHLATAVAVPPMNFWGANSGPTAAAVQLTAALARRPLPVAELRFSELLKLPTGLCPTVIVSQPRTSLLHDLRTASTTAEFVYLRNGRVVPFRCSLVVCSQQPVSFPALSFPLVTSRTSAHSLPAVELDALAQQWQPILLGYRARLWQQAAACRFAVPTLSAPLRQLAGSLGAALADAPSLQPQLTKHLEMLDHQYRSQQGQGTIAAVTEALLALVLARTPRAYVHEIAELANQSLADRHEKGGLTAQAVGGIIREHLGLTPQRASAGYRLAFDAATVERIQWMAEEMKLITHPLAPGGELAIEPVDLSVTDGQVGEAQSVEPASGEPPSHPPSSVDGHCEGEQMEAEPAWEERTEEAEEQQAEPESSGEDEPSVDEQVEEEHADGEQIEADPSEQSPTEVI